MRLYRLVAMIREQCADADDSHEVTRNESDTRGYLAWEK